MKRFKFWLLGLSIALLAAGGFTFGIMQNKADALAVWRADLKNQAARAGEESRIALQRYGNRQADMEVLINRRVIDTLFAGLEGFESVHKRTLKVTLTKLTPTFQDGTFHLEANGAFSSPFYTGPIEASFYVFTRLTAQGSCRLDLRVAGARATGNSFLSAGWLEALIVDRIQRKLKLPEIDLPLGIEQKITVPKVDTLIEEKGLTIRIPARDVFLRTSAPRVVVTEEYLGVFVQQVSLDETVPLDDPKEIPEFQRTIPEGVRVSVRFDLLSTITTRLIEPPEDVFLEAERMEKVYYEKKKVLGIKMTNRADLVNVNGNLDIQECRLEITEKGLALLLGAGGGVTGRIDGQAYGLKLDQPFKVDPKLHESVPIDIHYKEDHIALIPQSKTLILNLDIETEIGGYEIGFHHDLELETDELMRPLKIPHHFSKEMQVPSRIEDKQVTAYTTVPLALSWRLGLPEEPTGHMVFEGTVKLNPDKNQ